MSPGAWLIANEANVRLGAFVGLFALLALLQWQWPRRQERLGRGRVFTNLSLVLIDTLVLRVIMPLLAFDLALQMHASGRGLLHGLSPLAGIVVGLLILDLTIYWQHRLFHVVPFLWRLHRVHHADLTLDVTTAVRFHPLEILLSMIIKLGAIAALGIAPLAVLMFELLLNAGSIFTHANLKLPLALDRTLRWVLVTPDMHRIHHSVHRDETNSNFGFHLSLWDRLFRSYTREPRDGHTDMSIGLTAFRDPGDQSLLALLLNPFRTERSPRRPR